MTDTNPEKSKEAVPPMSAGKKKDGGTMEIIKDAKDNLWIRLLAIHSKWGGVFLFLIMGLSAMVVLFSFYFCWFYLMRHVWDWGFYPPTWRAPLAVLAAFFLCVIPFTVAILVVEAIGPLFKGYVEKEETARKSKFKELNKDQKEAEATLAAGDDTKLIPLIQYSRIELESYYTMGLSQTQRSFRYSIWAMWIGFIVILSGIGLYLFPFGSMETRASLGNIHIITAAGGVIIELISALFLWMYRSSINQFHYFYNRQMHLHNVLLCDRIASSMTTKKDETKKFIVETVLRSTWSLQPIDAPGKGMDSLIQKEDIQAPSK